MTAARFRNLNLGCGARFHADWVNADLVPADPARVVRLDLQKPLPFAAGTFDAVYHSHVLEHLPRSAAPRFLAECRRVLRPGGILRVVVPDLETIARLYLENLAGAWAGDATAVERHEWMTLELLDQLTREQSGGEMLRHWSRNPMPAEDFVVERMGGEVRSALERIRRPGAKKQSAAPADSAALGRFRNSGEVHKWMYDRASLRALLASSGFANFAVCRADESRIAGWPTFHLDTEPDGSVRKPDSLFAEAIATPE